MGFINKGIVKEQIQNEHRNLYLNNSMFCTSINVLMQSELIDTKDLIDLIANLCEAADYNQKELIKYIDKYGVLNK